MKRRAPHPDQYLLPFEAARGELLAQARLLRGRDLGISDGRAEGVVQLLERLLVLSNDLTAVNGVVTIRAKMKKIARGIDGRSWVHKRTVQRWRADAQALGILRVDILSHSHGRSNWNAFHIDLAGLRRLCSPARPSQGTDGHAVDEPNATRSAQVGEEPDRPARPPGEGGHGWTWVDTVSRVGWTPCPAQGVDTMSTPIKSQERVTPTLTSSPARPSQGNDGHAVDEPNASRSAMVGQGPVRPTQGRPTKTVGECVRVFSKLGVAKAATLVAEALERGCDTRSLLALARWFELLRRRHPSRWREPGSVLMIRLRDALPGFPFWMGWIPGDLPSSPASSSPARPFAGPVEGPVEDYRAARRRAVEQLGGLSAADEYRRKRLDASG